MKSNRISIKLFVFIRILFNVSNAPYSSDFKSFTDVAFKTSSFLSTPFFHYIVLQKESVIIDRSRYPYFENEVSRLNDVVNTILEPYSTLISKDRIEEVLHTRDIINATKHARKLISFPEHYNQTLGGESLSLGQALDMVYNHAHILSSAFMSILKLDKYVSSSISNFLSAFDNFPKTKDFVLKKLKNTYIWCLDKGFSNYMTNFIHEISGGSEEINNPEHINILIQITNKNLSKIKEISQLFKLYKQDLLRYLKSERKEISMIYDTNTPFHKVKSELKYYWFTGMMFSLSTFVSTKLNKVFKEFKEEDIEDGGVSNTLFVLTKTKLLIMKAILYNYKDIYKYIFVIIVNRFQLYQLNEHQKIEQIREMIKNNLNMVIRNLFKILKQKYIKNLIKFITELVKED